MRAGDPRWAARGVWCAGFAIALNVLLAAPAGAQELSEADAARVFEEGLAAFDRGEPAAAVETWRVLLDRAPAERAWRIHYNLGLAYEAMDQRARAIESFEAFSRRVGEEPGSLPIAFEERRQDAVDRAQKLRPFVGLLRVNRPDSDEAIMVTMAGGERSAAGFSRYVEPGEITLTMGEGPRALERRVEVGAGVMITIVAERSRRRRRHRRHRSLRTTLRSPTPSSASWVA